MNDCLTVGGRPVEPGHFRLMMACAALCQASADQMLIGTPHHEGTDAGRITTASKGCGDTELALGVDAQGQSLEAVAEPLSS